MQADWGSVAAILTTYAGFGRRYRIALQQAPIAHMEQGLAVYGNVEQVAVELFCWIARGQIIQAQIDDALLVHHLSTECAVAEQCEGDDDYDVCSPEGHDRRWSFVEVMIRVKGEFRRIPRTSL